MPVSAEGRLATMKEFLMDHSGITLRFNNEELENLYQRKRVDALNLSKAFKYCGIALMGILVFRRIQLFSFTFFKVEAITSDLNGEYLQLGGLIIALALEVLVLTVPYFSKLKGFFAMVYLFFMVTYSSFTYISIKPCSVPIGIPMYMGALVIGAVYVQTWMVAACGTVVGLIIHVSFNHYYDFPLYELFVFDTFYFASYILMFVYYYTMEFKDRYEFYFHYTQSKYDRSYRKLLRKLPNGIVILDKNNNPLFYNRIIEYLMGIQSSEISDLSEASFGEAEEATGKQRQDMMQTFSKILQTTSGKTLQEVVEEWSRGDLMDNNKYVYKTQDNETTFTIKGLQTNFRSLRDCKTLILEDQSSLEMLSKLDEKYQKLYVASIVHDIRTPLNGIVGMLEMMDAAGKTDEEQLYISVAKKTCKLLLFLTYDITDFSQLEANKFKANLTRNVTRDVLRETMQMVLFRFERKKLEHFEEISPSVPFEVYIDKNRYMQILLNLLGNALKFTFEGHVKVHLDYEAQTDTLITMVRDTGIGIEEKDVPQLFKLFGKLENSSALNPQGVGFGLAICRRLCESLGGYINVVTKYGVGSTFTFAIRANMESLSPHSSISPSNQIPSNISSLVIPGSINAKILNYK